MRLINVETLELREFTAPPRYAILSHRWANEELTFKDYHKLHELNTAGVEKIKRFCAFVRAFKVPAYHIESDERLEAEKVLEWAWIDTCCIDKSSSSELSEAINSMWAWYRNAEYCVAYLNDVQNFSDRCVTPDEAQSSSPAAAGSLLDDDGRCNTADSMRTEMRSLLKTEVENSEWFTRGWVSSSFEYCQDGWDKSP